jgi:dihydroxyacetone kinase-like predicted kinase
MCKKAAEFAWNTMYEPCQGTMLTAMANVPCNYTSRAPERFIYDYHQKVLDSLIQGPDLLPVLKEHHTVDSGTLGFAYILQGLYSAVTGDDSISFKLDVALPANVAIKPEEKKYCVELLLETECADKLRFFLRDYGDELIILEMNGMTKLHIHTDDALAVVKKAEEVSYIIKTKTDNMKSGEHWEE